MLEFQCCVEMNDERFTCDAREIKRLQEIDILGLPYFAFCPVL